MSSLQNGIITTNITSFSYSLIGLYFTPTSLLPKQNEVLSGQRPKFLLLYMWEDRSKQIILLSSVLNSAAFSQVYHHEPINPPDSKHFKLVLANMQSGVNTT